ncbi:Arc family DNA-binding protein [Rhizobium sp. KVB221]|uniref:Arc family DNA-binding protein n=1 Tax=Rhizobium setariae TaxID=2801340 RepID=A0A936YWL3_9HYPH|nr:Arc family DNA-binding protein [Rhizobium setariae]MBL0375207.1 Arc family DNA-binding protein [Rhizobium setariae]
MSSDQLKIRVPDGLRDRIKQIASQNRRSMNSEIVTMLKSVVGKTTETKKGEVTA